MILGETGNTSISSFERDFVWELRLGAAGYNMESSFSYTNTECEDAVFREDVTELTVDLSLRSSIEVTTQLVDFAKLNNAFCQDFVKYSVIKQPSALTTFALDEETG